MPNSVRPPAVAGSFYPDDHRELRKMVDGFLRAAKPKKLEGVKIIVVPHAGYAYSGATAAFAFKLLADADFRRVFLVGPSHYAWFPGLGEDTNGRWKTPFGTVKARRLSEFVKEGPVYSVPQAFVPEHCLEVELPFLQSVRQEFEIVPLLTGDIAPSEIADIISPLLDGDSLLVVSSDLSHYHPYEQANRIDAIANKAIPALDVESMQTEGEACGKTGVLAAMHVAKELRLKGALLDYRNSGDTAGDKLHVVGYGAYAFYAP